MSERLTIRTLNGAALRIKATNEIDARKELMQKYRIAMNKLADFEDKEDYYTLCNILREPFLDDIGRVFLPKSIRDKAGIKRGNTLRISVKKGQIIITKKEDQ